MLQFLERTYTIIILDTQFLSTITLGCVYNAENTNPSAKDEKQTKNDHNVCLLHIFEKILQNQM